MRLLVTLGMLGVLVATAPAATPRKATLATFAGDWWGHTRQLEITRSGYGHEHVDDGCCVPVLDISFRIQRPSGTTANATARLRVAAVRLWKLGPSSPAPRVGRTAQLRLRNGLLVAPVSGTVYCNDRTPPRRARLCGA